MVDAYAMTALISRAPLRSVDLLWPVVSDNCSPRDTNQCQILDRHTSLSPDFPRYPQHTQDGATVNPCLRRYGLESIKRAYRRDNREKLN